MGQRDRERKRGVGVESQRKDRGVGRGGDSHPSAAASRVLHRPSGANMRAAVSIPMVWGSKVRSAAAIIPCWQRPSRIMLHVIATAESEDEHAVSMLIDGPGHR